MDKPIAWIKARELTYMKAVVEHGATEWKTNLGLKPEDGDVPLYTATPHFLDPAKVARLMDEAFERGKKEIDMEQVKDIAQKLADCALLNSAPPQREWQGLTDEDRQEIERWIEFKEAGGNEPVPAQKIVTYVEAKLREKNHAI